VREAAEALGRDGFVNVLRAAGQNQGGAKIANSHETKSLEPGKSQREMLCPEEEVRHFFERFVLYTLTCTQGREGDHGTKDMCSVHI